MNRTQIFTILSLIILTGFLTFVTSNPALIVFLVIAIIFGLDLSSDELYENIEKLTGKKPGLIYGLTLFSFLTSFDEIAVSGASIGVGYYGISIGTMIGSVVVTLVIFLVVLKASRTKIDNRYFPFLMIVPIYILLLILLDKSGSLAILLLTFSVVIVSFFTFYYLGSHEREEKTLENIEKGVLSRKILLELVFFIFCILIFSVYLSKGTGILGAYLHIKDISSGYIIPGVLGSIPEIVVIRSSIKKKDSSSVAGIITGSTVIKGGILLPLLIYVFSYTPSYTDLVASGSLIVLLITIALIFY